MGLLENLFSGIISQLFYRFALNKVKRKAILVYLKTLQAARKSLIAAILIFATLQLMMLGLLGSLVVSVWLIPTDDLQTKLFILLGVFGSLFLVPVLLLVYFLSEKTWFRLSRAEELLKD